MKIRCCIVLLLAFCLGMPIHAGAYQLRQSRTGATIHWDRTVFPIHYYIDSNPAMPEGAKKAVIGAFQRWENVGPARPSFIYRSLIDNPAVANDDRNCIIWVEKDWKHGAHTIAHATTWYSLASGEIASCDIEINAADYPWTTTPSDEKLDLQNVLTHEIGHLLGLNDVFDPLNATMFSFTLKGEADKRSLARDDADGLSFLYPLSATFETIEASSFDEKEGNLSPYISPQDAPGDKNITLISACDWYSNGTAGEVAAISYDAESGYAFHVYELPDVSKGEKGIFTLANDDWLIASGHNTRGMAVMEDSDGFKNRFAVLKDTEDGESLINICDFSSVVDSPTSLCSISLGKTDSTTHISSMDGNELYLLKKVNGQRYNLSLYKLNIIQETLSKKEDYGELPIRLDDEVLSLFPLEKEEGKATTLGVLLLDSDGKARIDFIEPTPEGDIAICLSVQLTGSSPVLATSTYPNNIVLITE